MFKDVIDMHMHVGVLGRSEEFKQYGYTSRKFEDSITYQIFLLYAGLFGKKITDQTLHEAAIKTIMSSSVERVVGLAMDPVYDLNGERSANESEFWVDNEYVLKLAADTNGKVLLGASIHPYDKNFEQRVTEYVDKGAVLIKWLPSAQQINLARPEVLKAMKFLATAKHGKPLPLLLHTGPEYAIPTTNPKTKSYDFLSWGEKDEFANIFNRWYVPDIKGIYFNINEALKAGAYIIFAHCGLPYFPELLFDHSDFEVVQKYLFDNHSNGLPGKCYADVSAFCTPVRKTYFGKINCLPQDYLLYGGDYPTPAFEIDNNAQEILDDMNAVFHGDIKRAFLPQDNMLDLNYKELSHFFPGHKMFTNFKNQFLA